MADKLTVEEMRVLLAQFSEAERREILSPYAQIPLSEHKISIFDAFIVDQKNSGFLDWLKYEILYRAAVRREAVPEPLIAFALGAGGWGTATETLTTVYMEKYQYNYKINGTHNFTRKEEKLITWFRRGEKAIDYAVAEARKHNAYIRNAAKEAAEKGEDYRPFYSPVSYYLDDEGEPQRHAYDCEVDPEPDGSGASSPND